MNSPCLKWERKEWKRKKWIIYKTRDGDGNSKGVDVIIEDNDYNTTTTILQQQQCICLSLINNE